LKSIIVRRELKLLSRLVQVLARSHMKKRAAQYFYEQRRMRLCFDTLKRPNPTVDSQLGECKLRISLIRQKSFLQKLISQVSMQPKTKQLSDFLIKTRLVEGVCKIRQWRGVYLARSVSSEYLKLLTKQVANRRVLMKLNQNLFDKRAIKRSTHLLKQCILSKTLDCMRKGYRFLLNDKLQ